MATLTGVGGGHLNERHPRQVGFVRNDTDKTRLTTLFAYAGPDLARPDYRACDLLCGVLAARDEVLGIDIGSYDGRRHPRYDVARTVRPESIVYSCAAPAMVFYDGRVAPELPVVLEHGWPGRTLTFYEAELTNGGVRPTLGPPPWKSVGIVSANDRDIVARHKRDKLDTLTNYCHGQAIYCESGRAHRVWIPDR